MCYSIDSKKIITGGYDKNINIWNSETTDKILTLIGHNDYISSIICSPDGKKIVSGDYQGVIKFWNLDTGINIKTLIK
jgi:WD40 repeat protein